MNRSIRVGGPIVMFFSVLIGLGCDQSPITQVEDLATVQQAVGASDLPADLGMAPLRDLSIETTSTGRRLLRFSTIIVNVGTGPFEAHGQRSTTGDAQMTVSQRVADASGGWRDVPTDAVMIFGGDGHDHWHIRNLETAELIRLDNGSKVGTSDKLGYCFWDNTRYRLTLPGAPQSPVYEETGCGDSSSLDTGMGLSVGWGDIYPAWLPDQFIDITGLGSGRYRLVVTADAFGWFQEANEDNNVTWVDIQLQGKGRRLKLRITGYGPTA